MAEVVWNGIDTFVARVQKIGDGKAIESTMGEIGPGAKDVMDSNTAVRTGELKAGNTLAVEGLAFTLSNAVKHAVFVERGTRYMAAQPFLAPAVEYAVQQMKEKLPKALEG